MLVIDGKKEIKNEKEKEKESKCEKKLIFFFLVEDVKYERNRIMYIYEKPKFRIFVTA